MQTHFVLPEHPADLYAYERAVGGVRGFAAVDAAQRRRFDELGFLVIEEAFAPAEVEAAMAGLDRLIDGEEPAYGGVQYESIDAERLAELSVVARRDHVRKLMGFVPHEPRLLAVAEHPALRALLGDLLGETPKLFQDMALLKPAGFGSEKPWHQDNAYFNVPPATRVVGVWIALDEATADNGCMHLIPGSHRSGPAPHFQRRDWQLCDTDIPVAEDVMVPLAPGGCLIFQGLMWHGTPANRSARRRRALQFHYHGASVTGVTQEERLAAFGAEGRDVSC